MTSPGQNHTPDRVRNAEETLRLLATVPVPDDLVDRVQARLAAAPPRSFLSGSSLFGRNGWMFSPVFSQGLRGCAAAAIVLFVAGGGFAIYSRVQPSPSAQVIEMPARVGNSGSFSNAGAMRTPDTLNGPVLANPALANPALAHPAGPARQNVTAPPQSVHPKPKPAVNPKKAPATQAK
jgi:hypothetical protein